MKVKYGIVAMVAIVGLVLLGARYASNYREANPSPVSSLYWDTTQSQEARVEDLLSQMTVLEKIGQLALVEKNSISRNADITEYGLGALLSGGGGKPEPNTPEGWRAMVDTFQRFASDSRLGIPLLYGVDAVHGHANVPGATIFPHAIGLGASHDADLVRRIGAITAQEMAATGMYWNLSPSADVVQDVRWGRTYETFGDDSSVVSQLVAAYLEGLQSHVSDARSVIGTAKHYVGTGAMTWGSSNNPDFMIDQGDTSINEATLRAIHLPPFTAAVNAGVNSIMVAHTSWNDAEVVTSHYLLTDVLKEELGFQGFVVSDWNGVSEIAGSEYLSVVAAVNAGVDMIMLPYDYKQFVGHMWRAMAQGDISSERLDDAVRRILHAKFAIGLFDGAANDLPALSNIGSSAHREVAREAVRKSLVLLKNNGTVPLDQTVPRVVVAGSSANDLGRQSGGWTIEWQGISGNALPGTTILDAVRGAVSKETTVEYDAGGNFTNDTLADVGIAVVGEAPYAEGWGDNANPTLSTEDLSTIAKVKAASKKVVVIIVSGRPLDIQPHMADWDAVIAAWLPGSEGDGITDVLFGDHPFTAKLPVDWPL